MEFISTSTATLLQLHDACLSNNHSNNHHRYVLGMDRPPSILWSPRGAWIHKAGARTANIFCPLSSVFNRTNIFIIFDLVCSSKLHNERARRCKLAFDDMDDLNPNSLVMWIVCPLPRMRHPSSLGLNETLLKSYKPQPPTLSTPLQRRSRL